MQAQALRLQGFEFDSPVSFSTIGGGVVSNRLSLTVANNLKQRGIDSCSNEIVKHRLSSPKREVKVGFSLTLRVGVTADFDRHEWELSKGIENFIE